MTPEYTERAYKSLWHAAIAVVGVYEYQVHRSLLSKVLAVGLIAFHVDAAIADARGVSTLPQKLLRKLQRSL
jgi:hypothetical protein